MEFLSTIETSAFSAWVRESSSLFAYPGILFLHTAGLATVVGLSAMVALRLLGFARELPVPPLERFFPIIWAGVWISAMSGVILFAADATTKATSVLFGLKMVLIALAVMNLVLMRRVVFRDPHTEGQVSTFGKWLAAASLLLWCGAMTAGRVMTSLGR